ncbi:MAG: hypothetical protein NC311_02240 [Muribaculaceae bacterium]|nr:hypothetical protein [Muribaculaceae bacterium]
MKYRNIIKLSGAFGIILVGAMSCASSRDGTTNDKQIISTDTLRVAHVRYIPERDYINMEFIKNGEPAEQYTETTAAPESETTFFGDTILVQHKRTGTNLINISATRRMRQR